MYKGREKWLPILFSFATTFLFYTPTLFTSIVWLLWFSNRKFNCYSSHFLGRGNWGGPRAGPDRERERKKPKFSWSDLKRTSGSNIYRGKKTQHFFFSNSELRISKTFAKSRKRRIFLFVESNFFPSKKGAFEDKFLGFLTYLNYFSGNNPFNLVYAIQQQNTTELNKWSETNISSTGEKNQKANETDEET